MNIMLEGFAPNQIVVAVAALLGVLFGLVLGRFVLPGYRRAKRLQAELDQLRLEHENYLSRVSGHFYKTAELVGQMTASYKAVYDHLADGAQTLCRPASLPPTAFAAQRLIVDPSVVVSAAGASSSQGSEATTAESSPGTQTATPNDQRADRESPERAEPRPREQSAAENAVAPNGDGDAGTTVGRSPAASKSDEASTSPGSM